MFGDRFVIKSRLEGYEPPTFVRQDGSAVSDDTEVVSLYDCNRNNVNSRINGVGSALTRSSSNTALAKSVVPKIIKDVVHDHMEIPLYIQDFVDSVQVQRLRDLKQVGTTSFVFPCASHHRFEHSLGVSHLAGYYIDRLKTNQPELEITEQEQKCIRIAGLCHDLGHGPFSHAFESWAHRTEAGKGFHHEQMSIKMLNYLIDDKGLDYSTEDIKLIESLITGKPLHGRADRRFIYDIVANERNSIDVDKFDYLARDSYYLGRAIVCDFTRLIEFSRVIHNEICYCSKEVYNLYELFHTRYSLHKLVYSHKVGKAIEFMISDAFMKADPYLKISEQLDDPREFITLNDCLLNRIEFSKEKELEESRKIIKNIRTRNIYKFVDEVILLDNNPNLEITAEKIANHGSGIVPDDIIVENLKLNYGLKDHDPVQQCSFYTRYDNTSSVKIGPEHISLMIPREFQEKRIRIFTRNKEKSIKIQEAFRKLLHDYDIAPNPSTTVSPMKPTTRPNEQYTCPSMLHWR